MPSNYYSGAVDFLIPDGTPVEATADAGFRQGRWTGVVTLRNTERRIEQGDVCHISLGEENLRIIITDQVGTRRYSFIALIKPDPFESL
jgi:hypothetical protein